LKKADQADQREAEKGIVFIVYFVGEMQSQCAIPLADLRDAMVLIRQNAVAKAFAHVFGQATAQNNKFTSLLPEHGTFVMTRIR